MDSQDKNPVPRYVVNAYEIEDALHDKLNPILSEEVGKALSGLANFSKIISKLDKIKLLLPYSKYKVIVDSINIFLKYNPVGVQKISSKMLDVPPIISEHKIEFIFNNTIFITGLEINQNGWKKNDHYSLNINENQIINKCCFKETGEHKYLNTYCLVPANTPIIFILNNNSGNSRKIFVDLEYIEEG